MKAVTLALIIGIALAVPVLAAPGDPRLIQGTLEWPQNLNQQPFVVVRGDDGALYYANVTAAERRGTAGAGARIAILGVEGSHANEIVAMLVTTNGPAVAPNVVPAVAAPTAPAAVQPSDPVAPPAAPPSVAVAPAAVQPPVAVAPAAVQPPVAVAPAAVQPSVAVAPAVVQPPVAVAPAAVQPSVAVPPAVAQPSVAVAPAVAQPSVAVVPAPAQPSVAVAPAPAQPSVLAPTPGPAVDVVRTTPRPFVSAPPGPAALPQAVVTPTIAQPARPGASTVESALGASPIPDPSPRWTEVQGVVQAQGSRTLVLKTDDGQRIIVDVSALSPGLAEGTAIGSVVKVYGVPIEQRFKASGFIETGRRR